MIFVSIASYRDKQLLSTVNSCIKNADNPDNIRIGVWWQYDESEDLSALDDLKNVQSCKVYWKDVEGSVCWARYMLQQHLFNDEEYYFQVDSHTLFAKGWDTMLINMLNSIPARKPIISTGPLYYFDLAAEGGLPPFTSLLTTVDGYRCESTVKQQKLDTIDTNGYFMYGFRPAKDTTKPFPGRHLSAALLFTRGTWVREIPYDPNLYFQGEEGSLALRSFTRGYDIYSPNQIPIWHLHYQFLERKRHWNTFDKKSIHDLSDIGHRRYRDILEGRLKGIYGLGYKRTMKDWIEYSGVDLIKGIASKDAYDGVIPSYK